MSDGAGLRSVCTLRMPFRGSLFAALRALIAGLQRRRLSGRMSGVRDSPDPFLTKSAIVIAAALPLGSGDVGHALRSNSLQPGRARVARCPNRSRIGRKTAESPAKSLTTVGFYWWARKVPESEPR